MDEPRSQKRKNQRAKEKKERKLSPKEQEKLKQRRLLFRELHDCFAQDEVYDAEGGLAELEGLITGKFEVWQEKVKVKELELDKEITEKKKYLLEILADVSVADAVTYVRALKNAIDQHKYKKLKDLKVEGLDIKLL